MESSTPTNEIINPVLYRYRQTKRDVVILRESLIEERQRLQKQVTKIQEQMAEITNELNKTQ
jgi:hypothetical protein